MTTTKQKPHKDRRPTRAPKPGTFAWLVVSYGAHVPPKEALRRVRLDGYPEAKLQAIYNVRSDYQLNDIARAVPAVLDERVVMAAANRVAAFRAARARVDGAHDPELLRVITRCGTDAVRRALEHVERHGAAIEVVTSPKPAVRKDTAA